MKMKSIGKYQFGRDTGWLHPHRNPAWAAKDSHPYDYMRQLRLWPWWRVRWQVIRLKRVHPPAVGWRLWIYTRHGGRSLDLYRHTARKASLVTRVRNACRAWLSVVRADS